MTPQQPASPTVVAAAYVYANGWCQAVDAAGNVVIEGAWQAVKPWLQANYDGDVVFQDGTKTVACKGGR